MAPHSSTLVWKLPWMEEPGRLQSMGSLRVGHDWATSLFGEGNGNPLQCSCLENPRDGGTWWAAVYGVSESQTRLKRCCRSSSNILKSELINRFFVSTLLFSIVLSSLPLSTQWIVQFLAVSFLVQSTTAYACDSLTLSYPGRLTEMETILIEHLDILPYSPSFPLGLLSLSTSPPGWCIWTLATPTHFSLSLPGWWSC